MSCLLPFPASHISCPLGLLVHLSPEPLQVLKASDGTSTPAPTPTGKAPGVLGVQALPSHWRPLWLTNPTTPTARASENGLCPRTFPLPSWRLVARSPLVTLLCPSQQSPVGRRSELGRWGLEGKGALSCLLGQGPRSTANQRDVQDCDERNTHTHAAGGE